MCSLTSQIRVEIYFICYLVIYVNQGLKKIFLLICTGDSLLRNDGKMSPVRSEKSPVQL